MTKLMTATREEWLAARLELLEAEKELTRRSDELARMSAFALEDAVVYHAYSTCARGLDGLWGMYQWLDRAPRGRNETGVWWRRHDEYNKR
jgi:predicted dithiol-disulfide oxidoreductase (DUF899 family)